MKTKPEKQALWVPVPCSNDGRFHDAAWYVLSLTYDIRVDLQHLVERAYGFSRSLYMDRMMSNYALSRMEFTWPYGQWLPDRDHAGSGGCRNEKPHIVPWRRLRTVKIDMNMPQIVVDLGEMLEETTVLFRGYDMESGLAVDTALCELKNFEV